MPNLSTSNFPYFEESSEKIYVGKSEKTVTISDNDANDNISKEKEKYLSK
jgi:hypothetical protein